MDFVTDGSVFEIDGAAGVLPVFKDIADGRRVPLWTATPHGFS